MRGPLPGADRVEWGAIFLSDGADLASGRNHAPEPLVVPPMARVPQAIHIFSESPAGLRLTQRRERRNDRGIALGPAERPIVRGSTEANRLTCPLNRKAALSHQMGGDFPP